MSNKVHEIHFAISSSRNDKKRIMRISEEYGFSLFPTVLYLAHETVKLLKRKDIVNYHVGLNTVIPKHLIIRDALYSYKPFHKGVDSVTIGGKCTIPFTLEELSKGLEEIGISMMGKYFNSIVKSIIKHPYEASIIKVFGVYTKKHTPVLNAKNLKNTRLTTTLNLPEETYNIMKEISLRSGRSMSSMIKDTVFILCDTEFNNGRTPENGDIFKRVILKPPRVAEGNKHCKYGRLGVSIFDLKYSVQTKCLIEKYGIPSIRDLLKRIVYCIIKSYKGEIHLNTVRIIDNDDYNETRMVRDAYRKELVYGPR